MANTTDNHQDYEEQTSSSWASKLSKKLNRRSHGESNSEKHAGKKAEKAPPSSNPFARNYVPPEQLAATRRSASIEQQRSRPGTATSSDVYDTPSSAGRVQTSHVSTGHAHHGTAGAGPSTQRSPVSPSNQNVTGSSEKDVDDDFLGLDMKGRPRRRSDLSKQSITPEKSTSPVVSSSNPFARSSGSTPASKLFRRSVDKDRNDPQTEQAPIPKTEQMDSMRRKPVANTVSTDRSLDHKEDYASLPIYSQFKDSQTQTRNPPPRDVNSTLNKASTLLDHNSASNKGTDVDQLGTKVNRLALQSPEILSPESFMSADNYFEPKEGERCEDFKDQSHPTAQEIIERAKFDSADTTTHERMLPAVVHETIQPQVHEITQEHLTRDVHHYHHVHRLLPVHEVEVLPAKHYRIVDGKQVEMNPEQIPQSRVDALESSIIPKIHP